VHSLPVFLKISGQPVILVGQGEMADAKRRLWERAGARIVPEESEAAAESKARIAIVALEERSEAEAACKRLKARGLLVNAVDNPDLCDFTTPAIVDRDPVVIAIGTGGASAGLAKAIRQILERSFPAGLGQLARALYNGRGALKRKWPDMADRRRAIDAALLSGGPLDPQRDYTDGAVDQWLEEAMRPDAGQKLDLVLGSTDPDDLTLKQARLLGQADHIYSLGDVPDKILNRARADAQRHICENLDAVEPRGLTLCLHMKGPQDGV